MCLDVVEGKGDRFAVAGFKFAFQQHHCHFITYDFDLPSFTASLKHKPFRADNSVGSCLKVKPKLSQGPNKECHSKINHR